MKYTAFRNVYKRTKEQPDYRIYEKGNKNPIGFMYRNRLRAGLTYYTIVIKEKEDATNR